jgi:hypothetical protein
MRKIVLTVALAFFAFSCENETGTTIPYAQVNLALNVNFQDYALNAALANLSITQKRVETDKLGYGGILVINGFGSNPVNLFAYDLACPVEAVPNTLVVPDDVGLAKCPKCGAVFNIAYGNGNPESGTKYYLRSYSVIKEGNNGVYRVVN